MNIHHVRSALEVLDSNPTHPISDADRVILDCFDQELFELFGEDNRRLGLYVNLVIQNRLSKVVWFAFYFSGLHNRLDLVDRLIQSFGDDELGQALVGGASGGHLELVRNSVERGARDSFKAGDGIIDPLIEAIEGASREGHLEVLNFLFELRNNDLNEALYMAAYRGRREIVRELIQAGASDIKGALDFAVTEGHVELINDLSKRIEIEFVGR